MPGERIYTEPEYSKSNGWCICMQAGWTDVPFVNYTYTGAGLYMGWPKDPNNPPHKPNSVNTTCLVDSSADVGKMTPITKSYNALSNIGIAGDFLTHSEDAEVNARNSKYVSEYKGCSVNSGYINNTGLPVLFTSPGGGVSQCGYDPYADIEVGPDGYAGHEHYPASVNYSAGCGVDLTFLEPYYEFDYRLEDWVGYYQNEHMTEEERALAKESCDGYYVQHESQEIALPQLPLRPGRRHNGWDSPLFVEDSEREEGGKYFYTISGDTIRNAAHTEIMYDGEVHRGYEVLKYVAATYTSCYTVTFNPNGGELPEGTETLRAVDVNSDKEDVFNINSVVPVREGYTFAGWAYTKPHPTEEDVISERRNWSARMRRWKVTSSYSRRII